MSKNYNSSSIYHETNLKNEKEIEGLSLTKGFISSVEEAILTASNPISFDGKDLFTVNGQTGLWLNKDESLNWKGTI